MKLLLSFILPSASKVRTPFENFQHIIFAVPTYSNVTDGLVVLGDRLLFVLDEACLRTARIWLASRTAGSGAA